MNPGLKVFVLRRKGETEVLQHCIPSGLRWTVPVEPDQWAAAREKAFKVAIDSGARTVAIITSDVRLFRRPHDHGVAEATDFDQHGMWLYLERLARRFGHVYVPPLAGHVDHPPHGAILCPTIPLVAVYQVDALRSLSPLQRQGQIGLALCANGYDSYTVGDYFHQCIAYRPEERTLTEGGTSESWHRAYLRSIERLLS